MKACRVLVAGLGNVFLGDDAFGVEVVQQLRGRPQPEGVAVIDFGIRGLDLAFALERCEAAILVDAAARGGAPGTLYVIEPSIAAAGEVDLSAHAPTPAAVLRSLQPGAGPTAIRVVACEPANLGEDDLAMGLSEPVRAAVDDAIRMVDGLVNTFLREGRFDA